MWPIIRDVVVLPLVPVTAMTGTAGRTVVGRGPSSTRRTSAARSLTSASMSSVGSASSTRCDRLAERLRADPVAARGRPPRPGARPTSVERGRRADAYPPRRRPAGPAGRPPGPRTAAGSPIPASPGAGVAEPDPAREPQRRLLVHLDERGQVERQLDGRPREVEVRPFEHAQLDQCDVTASRYRGTPELAPLRRPRLGRQDQTVSESCTSRRTGGSLSGCLRLRRPWRGSRRRRARSRPSSSAGSR